MIWADDVESPNSHGLVRVIAAALVQHVQLDGQFAALVADDWVREVPHDVEAIRLNILKNR